MKPVWARPTLSSCNGLLSNCIALYLASELCPPLSRYKEIIIGLIYCLSIARLLGLNSLQDCLRICLRNLRNSPHSGRCPMSCEWPDEPACKRVRISNLLTSTSTVMLDVDIDDLALSARHMFLQLWTRGHKRNCLPPLQRCAVLLKRQWDSSIMIIINPYHLRNIFAAASLNQYVHMHSEARDITKSLEKHVLLSSHI
jgi:hypothetical protein